MIVSQRVVKVFLQQKKFLVPTQFLFLLVFKIGICVIIFSSLMRYFSGSINATKSIVLIVMMQFFRDLNQPGSMQSIKGVAVQKLNSVINLRSLPVIKEGNKTKVEKVEIEMKNVSFSYDDSGQ